jgi:hypothetical protein
MGRFTGQHKLEQEKSFNLKSTMQAAATTHPLGAPQAGTFLLHGESRFLFS